MLPLAAAFGRGVRKIRTDHGLTLDRVATTATLFGLKWSTARVVEFENGKIPITLPTLMRVGTALTALTEKPVTLSDMLGWDRWLELPGGGVIHSDAFRQAFAGGPVDLRQGDDVEFARDDATDASALIEGVPPGITARQLKWMHEYAGLADERAAKTLGLSLDEFLAFAFPVVGMALSQATHAGGSESPQQRGHRTRRLTRLVGEFVELYRSGDPRVVGIMSRLADLWRSEDPDAKAAVRASIDEVVDELSDGRRDG
ncbi:hypothetical protein FBY40_1607 [Microbacterium sp. SLBN-154]|nr:hypothetical protein FBY40_1607 [Microbacterium sp. SLBN-154]